MSAKLPNAAPLWPSLLGNLRGGLSPLRRNGDQRRRKCWATFLQGGGNVGRRYFDGAGSVFAPPQSTPRAGRERMVADQLGEGAFRRLFRGYVFAGLKQSDGRKNPPARNSRAQQGIGRVFSSIRPAVFLHSGGTQTKRGEIVGRRSRFGRGGSVFAPPESTTRAEKKSIMADRLDDGPRWQRRRGFWFRGLDCPYGKETKKRETSERSAVSGESSPRFGRNRGQGRRNSWATSVFLESRLCFRAAGVDLSSGRNKHRRRNCAKGHFGSIAIA